MAGWGGLTGTFSTRLAYPQGWGVKSSRVYILVLVQAWDESKFRGLWEGEKPGWSPWVISGQSWTLGQPRGLWAAVVYSALIPECGPKTGCTWQLLRNWFHNTTSGILFPSLAMHQNQKHVKTQSMSSTMGVIRRPGLEQYIHDLPAGWINYA